MAQDGSKGNYTQGYSNCTTATHQSRTAESDAAFLIPYIKKTDHILDAGCGPGTITTSLAKYASEGTTIGIDMSPDVLQKAKTLAAEANIPTDGPGSVVFEEGNIINGLAYPDDTFDVIFSSQVFSHIPPPDLPLQALRELRRVLKPGGILATRDGMAPHFYPQHLDINRLWVQNQLRGLYKDAPNAVPTGTMMPALFRRAGFDADSGKIRVGAGTTVFSGSEARKWIAWRAMGQLKEGDPFRQSWLDAGIAEEEIEETIASIKEWAETEDAWFASLQCEMLAWK